MALRLAVSRHVPYGSIGPLLSRSRSSALTAIRPFAAPGSVSGHCWSRSNGTATTAATPTPASTPAPTPRAKSRPKSRSKSKSKSTSTSTSTPKSTSTSKSTSTPKSTSTSKSTPTSKSTSTTTTSGTTTVTVTITTAESGAPTVTTHVTTAPAAVPNDLVKEPDDVEPEHLVPHAYDPETSAWAPAGDTGNASNASALQPGTVVKLVAWNMHAAGPGPAIRATEAMSYLERTFGGTPGHLVLMLQELRPASLQAILDHDWVRRNFVVSNAQVPRSYVDAVAASSDKTYLGCFNLMLVARSLPIARCFRVPFVKSPTSSGALVADLALDSGRAGDATQVIRLSTALLESTKSHRGYRDGQLASLSSFLKGKSASEANIVAGIVGGDMNCFVPAELAAHRAPSVNLTDVWEGTDVDRPRSKPGSYGASQGQTCGFHVDDGPPRQQGWRTARFLYTGSLDMVPVAEAQDVDAVSGLGRLGIMLKAEEEVEVTASSRAGRTNYIAEEFAHARQGDSPDSPRGHAPGVTQTRAKPFVSKHFAIAIGIRVP